MSIIDGILIAMIGGSALLGLRQGIIGIMAWITIWLLAGRIVFKHGASIAQWVAKSAQPDVGDYMLGYLFIFLAIFVLITLSSNILRSLIKNTILSSADKISGVACGAIFGAYWAGLIILVLGFTAFPKTPSWQNSKLIPITMPAVNRLSQCLPLHALYKSNLDSLPMAQYIKEQKQLIEKQLVQKLLTEKNLIPNDVLAKNKINPFTDTASLSDVDMKKLVSLAATTVFATNESKPSSAFPSCLLTAPNIH